MKYVYSLLITTGISLTGLTLAAQPPGITAPTVTMPTTPINRIAAVVNEAIITEHDLTEATRAAKAQFIEHHMPLPSEKELRHKVLESLIFQKLQLQLAKQNHITATDKQIDDTIAGIAERSHLSLSELKNKLALQHVDFNQFRKQLKEQIIITTLQQQVVAGKIDFTAEQIKNFKNKLASTGSVTEYHVLDYVIPLADDASGLQKQAAFNLAEQVRKALAQGKTPGTEAIANDLGWQPLESLPDLFSPEIAKMSDGSSRGPFLAGNGYHIIKLIGSRKQAREISDEEARQLYYQQHYRKVLDDWLKNLRKNSYVKVYQD